MEWVFLAVNALVYVLAFVIHRTKGRPVKIYYYFLGVQLFLILGYNFMPGDNDPQHLGDAYAWLLFYALQWLIFNTLVIVFLIKSVSGHWTRKALFFLALLLLEAISIMMCF